MFVILGALCANIFKRPEATWRATLRRGRVRGTNGRDRSASLQ